MNWAELTDLAGRTVYVNLNRVVSIEAVHGRPEFGEKPVTLLRTEVPDDHGGALMIFVQDAPEIVYEWLRKPS